MPTNDEYIKAPATRQRLHLPGKAASSHIETKLTLTEDEALDTAIHLHELDWRRGFTRDELRAAYGELPLAIYLRLPDSKRYMSAGEVLHEAVIAASRAEGDFMGAKPDYPAEESIEDGGPPGWGSDDALLEGELTIDGGSAEDREELFPEQTTGD